MNQQTLLTDSVVEEVLMSSRSVVEEILESTGSKSRPTFKKDVIYVFDRMRQKVPLCI